MTRYLFLLVFALISCVENQTNSLDLQGHRGARGLAPENSIPAFIMAAEMGVTTLELDLVVSKDSQLIVSHEPFFSPDFCADSIGNPIPEDSIVNIYKLDYEQIQLFDCGSLRNKIFPEQKLMATFKPLLGDVIDSVESYSAKRSIKPIRYNIELKTKIETDSVFHPAPSVFSDLVYSFIEERNLIDRITIQSFDFRTLTYFHKTYPDIKLVLLIENGLPWRSNIDSLGFIPEVYSCYYELLSQENMKEIQNAGMEVIPWTVNDVSDIQQLVDWGVDGIITDYPDRALKVIN